MIQPTPEQFALLNPTERISFRIAETICSTRSTTLNKFNNLFIGSCIWACGGRRMHIQGLEHLARYSPKDSLIFVANHRSFFDFFTVAAVLTWKTKLSRRILFPVRATFFYDNPLGPVINMTMSGMRMFPPILRERERIHFNRFSVERCVQELKTPATIMGLHPEGTRNKGDDPYAFLPAQSGVGKIALEAGVPVIPIFLYGMSSSLGQEFRKNWTAAKGNPIDVLFGAPIELGDLKPEAHKIATHRKASQRCMDGIAKLAEEHRQMRGVKATNGTSVTGHTNGVVARQAN